MSRIADALDKAGRTGEIPGGAASAGDAIRVFAPGGGGVTDAQLEAQGDDHRRPIEIRPVTRRTAERSARLDHLRQNELSVLHAGGDPVLGQQFRTLAGTLHQLQIERSLRSVVVTSAAPGEGKTLTAANLALTLSESFKRRVLLIDADLRNPMMAPLLGVEASRGLSNILAGADGEIPLVQMSDRLWLLPGGRSDVDPIGSLTSSRMRELLVDAAREFEWVIVDTPPVALVPDAALLSALVDGALFVVRALSTPSATVQRALAAVTPERVIGVVLNQAEKHSLREYGYYKRYGRKYTQSDAAPRGLTPPQV